MDESMNAMKRPHCLRFIRLMELCLNLENSIIISILYESRTVPPSGINLLDIQGKYVEVIEVYVSLNDLRNLIHELEKECIIQNILQGEDGRVLSLFYLTESGIEIKERLDNTESEIIFGVK